MAVDERPLGVVVEEAVSVLAAVVDQFDPIAMTGADARRLAELLARGERVCSAGKMLAARRVDECAAWTGGGARSSEEWLAAVSGTSVGTAVTQLDTAERLAAQPAVEQAVRTGEVSVAQAAEIVQAARVDPGAGVRLVDAARAGASMRELRQRCRQVANAASTREQDRIRAERLRAARYFRTWVDSEGAGRGEFKMAPAEYARFVALFKPFQDRCFSAARQAGRQENYAAYGADGLMTMALAAAGGGDRLAKAPPAKVIALIDLAALRRGAAETDETCEIVGVGSVPVSEVETLLGDAFFAAVLTDGTDIRRVVHLGRQATALQRTALWVRDRACVHCGSLHNLEIDHVDDWSGTLRTQLDKLAFLCRRCHRLKTHQGWRFTGSPGAYRLIDPVTSPDPPGSGLPGS
jgi:hypothetical protein